MDLCGDGHGWSDESACGANYCLHALTVNRDLTNFFHCLHRTGVVERCEQKGHNGNMTGCCLTVSLEHGKKCGPSKMTALVLSLHLAVHIHRHINSQHQPYLCTADSFPLLIHKKYTFIYRFCLYTMFCHAFLFLFFTIQVKKNKTN